MADIVKNEEDVKETPIKGLIEYDASHNFSNWDNLHTKWGFEQNMKYKDFTDNTIKDFDKPNGQVCPMYYQNLDIRHKRIKHMKEEIERTGLNLVRFPAFEGCKLKERINKKMKRGRYGCWMSAYKLWETVRDTNTTSLLLEDDIVFCDNFNEKLKEALEEANEIEYDMLLLSHNWHTGRHKVPITEKKNICSMGLFYGMQAYLITPKCAAYLCDKYHDDTAWPKAKDVLMGEINRKGEIKIRATKEKLVTLHQLAGGSDTNRG